MKNNSTQHWRNIELGSSIANLYEAGFINIFEALSNDCNSVCNGFDIDQANKLCTALHDAETILKWRMEHVINPDLKEMRRQGIVACDTTLEELSADIADYAEGMYQNDDLPE